MGIECDAYATAYKAIHDAIISGLTVVRVTISLVEVAQGFCYTAPRQAPGIE
jgi:hypothetical protein